MKLIGDTKCIWYLCKKYRRQSISSKLYEKIIAGALNILPVLFQKLYSVLSVLFQVIITGTLCFRNFLQKIWRYIKYFHRRYFSSTGIAVVLTSN